MRNCPMKRDLKSRAVGVRENVSTNNGRKPICEKEKNEVEERTL